MWVATHCKFKLWTLLVRCASMKIVTCSHEHYTCLTCFNPPMIEEVVKFCLSHDRPLGAHLHITWARRRRRIIDIAGVHTSNPATTSANGDPIAECMIPTRHSFRRIGPGTINYDTPERGPESGWENPHPHMTSGRRVPVGHCTCILLLPPVSLLYVHPCAFVGLQACALPLVHGFRNGPVMKNCPISTLCMESRWSCILYMSLAVTFQSLGLLVP